MWQFIQWVFLFEGEQKYRIKASESLKEKLLQKIKERPPEKNTMFDRWRRPVK